MEGGREGGRDGGREGGWRLERRREGLWSKSGGQRAAANVDVSALNTTPCEGGHGTHPHTHTLTRAHTHTHRKPDTRQPYVRARTPPASLLPASATSTTSRARVRPSARGVVWRELPPPRAHPSKPPNTRPPPHTQHAHERAPQQRAPRAFMRGHGAAHQHAAHLGSLEVLLRHREVHLLERLQNVVMAQRRERVLRLAALAHGRW